VRYHDRDDYSARQVLNPGEQELAWFAEEQIAEEIRLLYVGATRAERRIYLLAADFKQFEYSPLARCFGTERFDTLQATLETHKTEGTCGLLDLNETPIAAQAIPDETRKPSPNRPFSRAESNGTGGSAPSPRSPATPATVALHRTGTRTNRKPQRTRGNRAHCASRCPGVRKPATCSTTCWNGWTFPTRITTD